MTYTRFNRSLPFHPSPETFRCSASIAFINMDFAVAGEAMATIMMVFLNFVSKVLIQHFISKPFFYQEKLPDNVVQYFSR